MTDTTVAEHIVDAAREARHALLAKQSPEIPARELLLASTAGNVALLVFAEGDDVLADLGARVEAILTHLQEAKH